MLHSGEVLAVIKLLENQGAKNENKEEEEKTGIDSCDEFSRLTKEVGFIHPSLTAASS